MELDKKNRAILEELQENAKQSSREIAKKLGMPATTIHERIKKMERDGIINGYHVAINSEKIGMPTTAIALIRQGPKIPGKKLLFTKLAEQLSSFPEVQEVHAVTGEYDVIIKVRGRNEKEVGSFIGETIWNLPGVERTLSLLSYRTTKDTCKLYLR